ncbi:RNA methyltransferase [Candidatus Bathyarchaeota archaeon]|nr:RNA methyltransferase [Candidatus Bathyarchaeota archaeon]
MQRREQKLAVAIPVSIVSDIPHIREKTLKIGLVGRAAAIFRVNEIVVFSDNPGADQKRDRDMIVTLLSYMETPQYLRKRLFKIKPELRYAGILPPLRTPHHPLAKRARDLKVGDYREGAIMSITDSGSIVDMGVERPALLPGQKIPVNTRVTVKVANLGKRPRVSLADREEIEAYWGYTVTSSKASFGKIAKSGAYNLVVATSKMAPSLMSVVDELAERWKKSSNVLLAFGAPSHGLQEIVAQEKLGLDDVADFTVNTIPDQGTETVRTEEALYASLAMLNAVIK